jgi:hypothetical protein
MGYLGFRNADGNVYDTGVIDVVVKIGSRTEPWMNTYDFV